jgi:AAA+ ATPase superfamily predicted ATPase
MSEINLKELDFNDGDYFTVTIFGARRSGKSTLLKYIIQKYNLTAKYDNYLIISENDDVLNTMKEIIPADKKDFVNGYNDELINNLMATSDLLRKKGIHKTFLLIVDDVSSLQVKTGALRKIYMQSRHFKCSSFFLTQQITACGTTARSNSDYAIFGRTGSSYEDEMIYRHYLMGKKDVLGDEKHFCMNLIKKYTEDYSFLVIDSFQKKNNFYDRVKFIKAKI